MLNDRLSGPLFINTLINTLCMNKCVKCLKKVLPPKLPIIKVDITLILRYRYGAVDKRSLSRQMRPIYSVGRSNMTPEVARWVTHLSISGNMIKQNACKFCVKNYKHKILLIVSQNNSGNQEWFGRPRFPPWVVRCATRESGLIHSTVRYHIWYHRSG